MTETSTLVWTYYTDNDMTIVYKSVTPAAIYVATGSRLATYDRDGTCLGISTHRTPQDARRAAQRDHNRQENSARTN